MHKLKQIPEDFIVKEINTLKFEDSGEYAYYLLKKTSYNTVDAIKKICDSWKLSDKFVNFAGTKDRAAITEQYLSINHGPKRDLKLKDIELKYLGNGKERLNLGCLEKNYFEITIRNITTLPKKKDLIINYFDDQRFGNNMDNHVVGKLILKGRYEEACKMIPETIHTLNERPNDFIGALRSIPKKVLKIYVHAYQSHLWNLAAKELSKTMKSNIKIPLFGFGTEFNNKEVEEVYNKILSSEEVSFRDFVNKKIPELSEEGAERDLYIRPEKLEISTLEDDELNEGMKKCKLTFFLQSGAYATNVVKTLIA